MDAEEIAKEGFWPEPDLSELSLVSTLPDVYDEDPVVAELRQAAAPVSQATSGNAAPLPPPVAERPPVSTDSTGAFVISTDSIPLTPTGSFAAATLPAPRFDLTQLVSSARDEKPGVGSHGTGATARGAFGPPPTPMASAPAGAAMLLPALDSIPVTETGSFAVATPVAPKVNLSSFLPPPDPGELPATIVPGKSAEEPKARGQAANAEDETRARLQQLARDAAARNRANPELELPNAAGLSPMRTYLSKGLRYLAIGSAMSLALQAVIMFNQSRSAPMTGATAAQEVAANQVSPATQADLAAASTAASTNETSSTAEAASDEISVAEAAEAPVEDAELDRGQLTHARELASGRLSPGTKGITRNKQ